MRRINVPLLVALVASLALTAVTTRFVHRWQVKRMAPLLLKRAQQAAARGDRDGALSYFDHYLSIRPDDVKTRVEVATLICDGARTDAERTRALNLLEGIVRRDPKDTASRRRLVRVATQLGASSPARFTDARAHLDILLKMVSEDGELAEARARCEEGVGRYAEAAQSYERAVRHEPGRVECYIRLADLLRGKLSQPEEADLVMDRLVTANPRSARAYLARWGYHKRVSPGRASDDVKRAVELAPDDPDARLAEVSELQERGELSRAMTVLSQGLSRQPRDPRWYSALASVEHQAGHPKQAAHWLRRGLEIQPGDDQMRIDLVSLDIEAGVLDEARREINRLRAKGNLVPWAAYFEARILLNQGRWLEATQALERVRTLTAGQPALAARTELALGECYQRLGLIDKQYSAYLKAVELEPSLVPARRGLVAALVALGRIDEAVQEYRRIATGTSTARAKVELARLILAQNQQWPQVERRLEEAERLLSESQRAAPGAVELTILRAQILEAQGRLDEARNRLREAAAKHPKRPDVWLALADCPGNDDPLATLDEAQRKAGDRVDFRLARVRYWVRKGGPTARDAIRQLAEGLDRFTPGEQDSLRFPLADALARVGDPAGAERIWSQLASHWPDDLRIRLGAFDAALQGGQPAAIEKALKEIQRIEGPDGSFWRFDRARYLTRLAKDRDPKRLAEARVLLSEVSARKPNWPRVPLAEAEIDEIQGDRESAVKHYERAIELGETEPTILARLATLLIEDRRFDEADRILRSVPTLAQAPGEVRKLAAEAALRSGDTDRALALAKALFTKDSADYRDHLWLGRILGLAGQIADAEAPLRRATELAPEAPETWVALVKHLVQAGKRPEADQAIAQARDRLAGESALLALAQCEEAIGRTDRAKELYERALKAKPDDVATLRGIAGFYLAIDQPREAEPYLRKLLALRVRSREDAEWARHVLTMVLAAGGHYEALVALGILDEVDRPRTPGEPPGSHADSAEADRARAVILATQRGRARRREAIAILEKLRERPRPAPDDLFLLARLYEIDRNWPRARQTMRRLLETRGDEALYVAQFTRALLRHGETNEARTWVDRLERIEPGALRTLLLKGMVLKAEGKADAIVPLLEPYLRENPGQALRLATALEELGQVQAAEDEYRRHEHESSPGAHQLALAKFLGRSGRPREALDLCERSWSSLPPEPVADACVAILDTSAADRSQYQRVEAWLTDALRKHPGSASIRFSLAGLRKLQGRLDESEKLYRQVVGQDGGFGMALNNLAYLLTFRDSGPNEAARLIDRAIRLRGPVPSLLDTRAVVHLRMSRTDQAIDDLEEAVAKAPTALRYFHLAEAYDRSKDTASAVEAIREAKTLGLKPTDLHPQEQAVYQRLAGELATR